jgi:hypothetical protein
MERRGEWRETSPNCRKATKQGINTMGRRGEKRENHLRPVGRQPNLG